MQSEFEKRIEAYIESNDCLLKHTQRLEIEGIIKNFPVYRLPIKLLVFNVKNGRFAADLENLEQSLGRKLDAWKKTDHDKIKQILIDKSPHDTKIFKDDIKKRGQIDPGVITAAGVVINANRRMAILSELYENTSHDKYAYLETSILPHGTSETEIYKIEARLQYAKEFKQPFGAVNELLKIEEGLRHMTKKELAKLLVRDEKYIDDHIAQLQLLKAYSKYAWKKVDYKKIEEEQITEIITDVEKNIKKLKSEGRSASEINKLLEVHFAYIKSGCTYRDIRNIGKFVHLPNVEKTYVHALADLKDEKFSEESFKEKIDYANDSGKIKKEENRPVEFVSTVLEQIKEFQDKQFKITPDVKKYLLEISKIISVLLKK